MTGRATPQQGSRGWRENGPRGIAEGQAWTVLWRSRELIGNLAMRDIRLRYRQAVLGVIWVVAQPVASVAVFTLVFSYFAKVSSRGAPYPVFALVGLVTWTYFTSSVTAASSVLVENANLITKVYFPRAAAPAAALVSPLVDLVVALGLVGVALVAYGVFAGANLLVLPLWLSFLVLTAFGVALWSSALNVRYRDVQYAIGPLMQLWLFASPVAYPASLLSGWQLIVYSLNPVVGVLELGRWTLLGTPWPGLSLGVSALASLAVLVGGLRYFRRSQVSFADVI